MNIQELKVNYKKLLNKAVKANGRKETVSYLNRAAKIKSKIYSNTCLLYTSPSPRDQEASRMPSSA